MLQEVKELQDRAVRELISKVNNKKKEITFRSPTGSGKTYMMADFMNRIIKNESNIIFLVSSLSKGGLAEQNYKKFVELAEQSTFPMLKPYLISSTQSGEGGIHIPSDRNVYVLPRDLFKKGGNLMKGYMLRFLQEMTDHICGQGKIVYLIKDECHQATNNLDALSDTYFNKTINFSATPNLRRGQNPEVQITDSEAEEARLIKRIDIGSDDASVEDAIVKFEEVKKNYRNELGVNPCLIIQISNKDKAHQEWQEKIFPVLNKAEHQDLKYMVIMDKEKDCITNDSVKKLPVNKWRDYAKDKNSTIDVIIFKMVISEGWDIPRACMLYQIRDTQSKQLDEQVIGRVRRNPRLLDFEKLSPSAQNLATTAWVWGVLPCSAKKTYQVKLYGDNSTLKVKTTHLKTLTERVGFDLERFMDSLPDYYVAPHDIFRLNNKIRLYNNDIQQMCREYSTTPQRWWKFAENVDKIAKEYDSFICDYSQSMEVLTNDDGTPKLSSFPLTSLYTDNQNYLSIADWVWKRRDGHEKFSFDSEAEHEWAEILKDLAYKGKIQEESIKSSNNSLSLPFVEWEQSDTEKKIFLWGKNFPFNSDIKFEYYLNGIHNSYPDFIMKDINNNIHIFEVKSVNKSQQTMVNEAEYEEKIKALGECYTECSKKLEYIFYLPIKRDDEWKIRRYKNGKEEIISKNDFINSLSL